MATKNEQTSPKAVTAASKAPKDKGSKTASKSTGDSAMAQNPYKSSKK
ncbi:hypothetical protein [Luteimonas chenhongjianii]|nr:hypothetical protein [Luteimonas chenhongjianii]